MKKRKRKTERLNQASQWLDKIERAKAVKEAWREKFRVNLAYEYWEGNQRPAHIPVKDWITINKIFATLQSELPNLYAQDPEYYVRLKRSFNPNPMEIALYEQKAKIRQAMLNYLRDETELMEHGRLSVFDAHIQFGVCKVGHEADWQENPDAGQPVVNEAGEPVLGEDGIPLLEPKELPTNERWTVERLHPDDWLVDEDATPLKYAWCAQKIRRRLEEVRADERYGSEARQKVQATEISTQEAERERRKKGQVMETGEKEIPDLVVIWQIWDRERQEMLEVSEGCREDFLIAPGPYPAGIKDDPFVTLRYIVRDDSWYPLPPVSQLLDSQREFCETRSKVLQHRKRFNRKYTLQANAFDDPEMAAAKLEVGEDGTVLVTNGIGVGDVVAPISDAPLDMQVHTELVYLDRDFQDMSSGQNQRGFGGSSIDSATEAGIVEKRTLIRESDRQELVRKFLRDIGRKLDLLVQANLTAEYAVQVTGPEGAYWELVRPMDYSEIMGEFSCEVVVGSHTPQLPEVERAQGLNFLNIIAQAPQLALSPSLMRLVGQWFRIPEQQLNLIIQELQRVAQMMAQQQASGIGSQPGAAEGSRAQSAMPGMAMGIDNIRGGLQ
jgi:hypothetical protein